jgi:LmbE family N-acetylglucosaminyl deacetylase
MLPMMLGARTPLRRLLALGAHCDDIEIGCGGTILHLIERFPGLHVDWIVFSSSPAREQEARASAARFLAGCASSRVDVKQFRNGYFPFVGAEIKDYFEALKRELQPDLVLTHYKQDLHQDHRTLGELTWNTFRDHLIWEYEIPKYDGGLGSPNVFVPLYRTLAERKVNDTLLGFPSQASHPWFTADTFWGLMRLRGVECNAAEGLAEAFYARKVCLG